MNVLDNAGIQMCARYAFSPNKLKYCGPDKNAELLEYCCRHETDLGLAENLKKFETLYPYLQLIARSNKITDVFNQEVVEGYWLGNHLLDQVPMQRLEDHFISALHLKKKLSPKLFNTLVGKIPQGAIPHHNFHVFNIWKRTGYTEDYHTIESMDNCRISAGRVIFKSKDKNDNLIIIKYRPLIFSQGKLIFGEETTRDIHYRYGFTGFVENIEVGDNLSLHWGWVCDKLSKEQARNLEWYTRVCLDLANKKEWGKGKNFGC